MTRTFGPPPSVESTKKMDVDVSDEADLLHKGKDVRPASERKPKLFGKKEFYKRKVRQLEEKLNQARRENEELKKEREEIKNIIEAVYHKYGDHFCMYIQSGDHNVMTVDNDLEMNEVVEMLETLLKRTTAGLQECIKIQAENTEKMETMKETLKTLSTKLTMMETESRTTGSKMDKLRRDSTSVRENIDELQNLIVLAQNPEPTPEIVAETVYAICNYLLTSSNELLSFGLKDLPSAAQKFPRMAALKYGSRHENKLQLLLTGNTSPTPGRLEDRCALWIASWVRRHIDEDGISKMLLQLLATIDGEIIQEQEREIIQRKIHDKRSLSSHSSATLTAPSTTFQREILEKLEEVRIENQREVRELKNQLSENASLNANLLSALKLLNPSGLKGMSLKEELKFQLDHFKNS